MNHRDFVTAVDKLGYCLFPKGNYTEIISKKGNKPYFAVAAVTIMWNSEDRFHIGKDEDPEADQRYNGICWGAYYGDPHDDRHPEFELYPSMYELYDEIIKHLQLIVPYKI